MNMITFRPHAGKFSALAMALVATACLGAAEPVVTGTRATVHGITILTLTGSPRDNGFARGWLMAAEIRDSLAAIDVLVPAGIDFDLIHQMVLPKLLRPEPMKAEMDGVIAGLRAKLGDAGITLARIGRPLNADDLWCMMAVPDLACSSFAAWGDKTADGGLFVGRNLDYAGFSAAHLADCIVVHRPTDPTLHAWMDFTLSPLPGVSTAINDQGAFAAVLDAQATAPTSGPANLRTFVLADFVAQEQAGDTASQAGTFFRRFPILRGTNFMLVGAHADACVAEYDGNGQLDGGVTMRSAPHGQDWLAVTNHFCQRAAPTPCDRYAKLETALKSREKIATLDQAWHLIANAAQGSTLLTLAYAQRTREVLVAFTDGGKPASEMKPTAITLDEILAAGNAPQAR